MTSRIHESPTTLTRVTELHDKVRSLITSTAKGVAALVELPHNDMDKITAAFVRLESAESKCDEAFAMIRSACGVLTEPHKTMRPLVDEIDGLLNNLHSELTSTVKRDANTIPVMLRDTEVRLSEVLLHINAAILVIDSHNDSTTSTEQNHEHS